MIFKRLLAKILGVKPITYGHLKAAGFIHHYDDRELGSMIKDGVEMWPWNDEHWIVDALDQAGIDKEFHYMHELEHFFSACGLDMQPHNT